MENVKKMYTLSVPCKTQFIRDNSVLDVSALLDKLWISPSCECRISKNSLIVFNGLYQALYAEGDFGNYFKDGFCFKKTVFGTAYMLNIASIIVITITGIRYFDK